MPRHVTGDLLRGGDKKANAPEAQLILPVRRGGNQIIFRLSANRERNQLLAHGFDAADNVPEGLIRRQRIKKCVRPLEIQILIRNAQDSKEKLVVIEHMWGAGVDVYIDVHQALWLVEIEII